jgi:hypothetical protein
MLIAAIIAMTGYSCKEKGGKYIDQGEIHYNIDYKGNFGVPLEALPRNLVVTFKKDKILFEMIGMGNSGIVNLTNPEKNLYDTYFNLLGVQKYYYAAKAGEVFPGFGSMSDMILKKTSKTAVICGYNCKNIEASFPSDKRKIYNVWYTDEIKVVNPNASTPFSEIKGVLMDFFFIMGSSELRFVAESVYSNEIPDEVFNRKEKYTRISKENIENVMKGIFEYFKKP